MDLEPMLRDLAPRLLRYCTGTTGDPALGEDAAQEALAALVQRWRRYGPPDSPEAFAFRVAQRRVRRALLRRRMMRPLADLDDRLAGKADPSTRVFDRGRLDSVRRAVTRLPRHERDALLLVAVGGMNGRSAAGVLGISVPALKMRLHRARTRLKQMLELEDVEDTRTERRRS